jgi:nucleotide-binding universal stress UspA family protein
VTANGGQFRITAPRYHVLRPGEDAICHAGAVTKVILVGYDDHDAARRALERAIEEVQAVGGRLVVAAVVEMPLDPTIPPNFASLDDVPAGPLDLAMPAELEEILTGARKRVEEAGVEADFLWAAGDPAQVLVDAARDQQAGLIVLGSHHHGLLGRLFGADVAGAVKEHAGCDVLVVE